MAVDLAEHGHSCVRVDTRYGRPACEYIDLNVAGNGGTVTLNNVWLDDQLDNAHSAGPATYTCSDTVTATSGPCNVMAVLHTAPYTNKTAGVTFL